MLCENEHAEPHHCEHLLPSRGLAVKHDLLAVPLCRKCHNKMHHLGKKEWEALGEDIKLKIVYYLITYFGD